MSKVFLNWLQFLFWSRWRKLRLVGSKDFSSFYSRFPTVSLSFQHCFYEFLHVCLISIHFLVSWMNIDTSVCIAHAVIILFSITTWKNEHRNSGGIFSFSICFCPFFIRMRQQYSQWCKVVLKFWIDSWCFSIRKQEFFRMFHSHVNLLVYHLFSPENLEFSEN